MSTAIPVDLDRIEAIVLGLGGVLYADEPFDLAWIQRTFELVGEAGRLITRAAMAEAIDRFYQPRPGRDRATSVLTSEVAGDAWRHTRTRWTRLAAPPAGTGPALHRLAERWPLAACAHQPPEARAALRGLGFDALLDPIVLDAETGRSTPDPRLFETTLKKLGVPPDRTLVVGNRIHHDIAPARSIGCRTALITGGRHLKVPVGVRPEFVTAYRAARPRPEDAADATGADVSATDLADLADRLCGPAGPQTSAGA